jgi:transposase
LPSVSRTWARIGQTPLIKHDCQYTHLSTISAISEAGELYYQIQEESFKGHTIVEFLKYLRLMIDKPLSIIWDGAKIHQSEEVKRFLETIEEGMVWLYRFPPYSPELNPDEQVWHHLKNIALKNVTCRTKEELKKHLIIALDALKARKNIVAAFFCHPQVKWNNF